MITLLEVAFGTGNRCLRIVENWNGSGIYENREKRKLTLMPSFPFMLLKMR